MTFWKKSAVAAASFLISLVFAGMAVFAFSYPAEASSTASNTPSTNIAVPMHYEVISAPSANPQAEPEPAEEALEPEPTFADNSSFEYGFELPLKGATGYGVIDLNLRAGDGIKTKKIGVIKVGTTFEILADGSTFFNIRLSDGTTGWVSKTYTMINLPDVIPSIVYNDTNAYSSVFRSHYKDLSVTGKQLYTSLNYNARLDKNEYTMPVLFNMAVKLAAIQRAALADNNTLVLYEAYRPMTAQNATKDSLAALMSADASVRNSINGWGSSWFIASGVSNHQQGYAVDITLATVTSAETLEYGVYTLVCPSDYEEYEMPTPIHDLSPAAATLAYPVNSLSATAWKNVPIAKTMNENALLLQSYCVNGGLTPLASEWWHFNDLAARKATGSSGRGNFETASNLSARYVD